MASKPRIKGTVKIKQTVKVGGKTKSSTKTVRI